MEFKVIPEIVTPCVNNCNDTGNLATNNMCQKFFNAISSTSTLLPFSSTSSFVTSSIVGANKFGEKSPRSSSSKRLSPERMTNLVEIRGDLKNEIKETLSAQATTSAMVVVVRREGEKERK